MEQEEYQSLVLQEIIDERSALRPTFLRAALTGNQRGASVPWDKVILRPVLVKGQEYIQFSYYDAKKCITKNFREELLVQHLHILLEMPFRNIHIATAAGEVQINISKAGKPIIHRARPTLAMKAPDLSHNRPKDFLIPDGKPDPYLQAIGFMTQEGLIKAINKKV